MPIDKEDASESVVGEAAADVFHVADERIPAYRQRAVIVHVVRTVPVGNSGNQNCIGGATGDSTFTDLRCQHDVSIHREVGSVVLESRDRKHGDTLLLVVEQEGQGACHTGEFSCFFRSFGAVGK